MGGLNENLCEARQIKEENAREESENFSEGKKTVDRVQASEIEFKV